MLGRWFPFRKRAMSHTLDASHLENLVRRKPDFWERLGDAGGYLRDLFRSHPQLTVSAVEKRVQEIKKYRAVCYEKMDDHTAEQGRTYRHLQAIRERLKDESCPPWQRATLLAKAEEELFAYRNFGNLLKQWQKNVRMATLIVSYLERLVAMMIKPMQEGELERWSVEFHLQAEKELELVEKINLFEPRPTKQVQAAEPPAAAPIPSSSPAPPEPSAEAPAVSPVEEELERLLEQ